MILGIDIGTSKLCVMAFDDELMRIVAVVNAPNDSTLTTSADRHEQDPGTIRESCFSLLAAAQSHPCVSGRPITGISVTGQMHGVMLVDKALHPVSPFITWRDRREDGLGDFLDRLDPAIPPRLGCVPAQGYGGVTLSWLARHGHSLRGVSALGIGDYLVACLTGVTVTDPTHAAGWGLWDVATGAWDTPTLKDLGIPPEVLPQIIPASTAVGELSRGARERLSNGRGAVVTAPLGDNQAGVIGATVFDDAGLVCNIGTGGQVSTFLPGYVYRSGLETRPMPFGGCIAVGSSLCGGWAYAYLCSFFQSVIGSFTGNTPTPEDTYAWMNALAAQTTSGGLMMDPRFSGTRAAPEATGAISGIDTDNWTPAKLIHATLEGIVRELADLWQGMEDTRSRRVVAAGNAPRRNPLLKEIITTAFGLPCVSAPVAEEAALGAILASLVGLGIATPDQIRSHTSLADIP